VRTAEQCYNVALDTEVIGSEGMDWIGSNGGPCDHGNEKPCSIRCGKFLDCLFHALVRLFG